MNLTNKTVLITGGGSGIGFETAKLLSEKGNKVIITGRSENRLKQAADKLINVDIFVADITNKDDVGELLAFLTLNEKLDILINNAGQVFPYDLGEEKNIYDKAVAEMNTNYSSVIYLTEKLLPMLKAQTEAAIVNVTSIVAFAPSVGISTYSSSKAALRSFTLSLRLVLAKTSSVKVFELMPPLVNTDFSKEIGGHNGISPIEVATGLINAIENEVYEIYIGDTENVYNDFFFGADGAFELFNKD